MTSCIDLAFGYVIEHVREECYIMEEDPDTGRRSVLHTLAAPTDNQRNRLAWQWLRERAVRLEAAAESLELFLEGEEGT